MKLNLQKQYAELSDLSPVQQNHLIQLLSGFFKQATIESVLKNCPCFPMTLISEEGLTSLCRIEGDRVVFPKGLTKKAVAALKVTHFESALTVFPKEIEDEGLMDHQRVLVEQGLIHGNCCEQSPTGSGKSRVLFALAKALDSAPVLLVVSKKDLMMQLQRNLEQYLGKPVGIIGNRIGRIENVTVGLSSTLKQDRFIPFLSTIKTLLVDEVHNFATGTAALLSERLENTEYRIGLSATVFRNKESALLVEALIGPLVYKVSFKETVQKGIVMSPRVQFFEVPRVAVSPRLISLKYSHMLYNRLYKLLIVGNKKRNEMAARIAKKRWESTNHPVVLIVNRVNPKGNEVPHSELLRAECRQIGLEMPIIHGGSLPDEVSEVFEKMRNREIPGCIAGPNIMSEGIDIPAIATVILCGAGSSSIEMIQRMGRAIRRLTGKCRPLIVDFIDQQWVFESQSKKRQQLLEECLGESAEIITLNRFHGAA